MNNPTDQKINVSSSSLESNKRLKRINRRAILTIIVSLAIVITGAVLWQSYNRSRDKPQAYSFDQEYGSRFMATHLLQGETAGTGVSFKRPMNGFVYLDSPLDKSDPRLTPANRSEAIIDKGKKVEFGQRLVSADSSVYYQSLLAALIVSPAEQESINHRGYFNHLIAAHAFLNREDLAKMELTLENSTSFTNSSISKDAKISDIKIANATSKSPIKKFKGQLIEIKGSNAVYLVLIGASDEVWASSPKTWQAIKDSIKVDQ